MRPSKTYRKFKSSSDYETDFRGAVDWCRGIFKEGPHSDSLLCPICCDILDNGPALTQHIYSAHRITVSGSARIAAMVHLFRVLP